MKSKKIVALAFVLISFSVEAQVNQEWVAFYSDSGGNGAGAESIVVDDSGNVYVTGNSFIDSVNIAFVTVKYNTDGIEQWVKKYQGAGTGNFWGYATAIGKDSSGNIYVGGYGPDSTYASYDFIIIKYNSFGNQQWVRTYDRMGNSGEELKSMVVDNAGNVYATGVTTIGPGQYAYATVKYNSSGIKQWDVVSPGESGYERRHCIALDDSRNVYLTTADNNYDYAVFKYNSSGIQQWSATYDGGSYDLSRAITVDKWGNVFVTGSSDAGTDEYYATVKYNNAGVFQWAQTYNGGTALESGWGIAIDDSGNAYVTGYSMGNTTGYDIATIKYDSSGVQKWVQRYDDGTEDPWDMKLDEFGNVYISGANDPLFGGADFNYITMKYSSGGTQEWVMSYITPQSEQAKALAINSKGNVYVTGGSNGEYTTIKYSQSGWGIEDLTNENQAQVIIYPNPFSDVATISISHAELGSASQGFRNKFGMTFTMYDLLGREVYKSLILNPKSQIHRGNLPSGMYFYKVFSDREILATGKIVIQD